MWKFIINFFKTPPITLLSKEESKKANKLLCKQLMLSYDTGDTENILIASKNRSDYWKFLNEKYPNGWQIDLQFINDGKYPSVIQFCSHHKMYYSEDNIKQKQL